MSSERPAAQVGSRVHLVDGATDSSPMDPRTSGVDGYVPGELIAGKYQLLRRLGEGGMASVWVAHNETLDIDVAVKFIRADIENDQLGARLLQEARAVAKLGHPAIVRVSDYGNTQQGDPYIVMELLDGEDLAVVIQERGRVPAVKAVRTVLPVAHALAIAHEKGIVHRDLKPDNIFLVRNDDGSIQPKLVDFGIAKLEKQGFERLTAFGSAMGSPAYMSPEQARGLDADHRADIWGLCVVIYETVTGRPPFHGNSYNALLRSIVEDDPIPITSLAAGDQELRAILEKGMDKEIERRWQSMRELGTALAEWLVRQGVSEDIVGASLQATWIQWKPNQSPSLPPSRPTDPSMVRSTRPAPRDDAAITLSEPSGAGVRLTSAPDRRAKLVAWIAVGVTLLIAVPISGLLLLRANDVEATSVTTPPPASALLPSSSAIAARTVDVALTTAAAPEPGSAPVSSAKAKLPPRRDSAPAREPTRQPRSEHPELRIKTTF